MKSRTLHLTMVLLIAVWLAAETKYLVPGKDRWAVKTSTGNVTGKGKAITYAEMVGLAKPSVSDLKASAKDSEKAVNPQAGADDFHEGDRVALTAYIQLVALEATKAKSSDSKKRFSDGDYHIQVTDAYDKRDQNIVVEVPHPDFVKDAQLKSRVAALRDTLRTKLNNGDEFKPGGNCMVHPPRVRITGQLFLDSFHAIHDPADPGGGRGKMGHPAATVWEIHPITDIAFLDKKGGNKPDQPCPATKKSATATDWQTLPE